MADHRTEDRVDLAPAEASARTDYMHDFYSWLMEQARAVREGRWGAVDRHNLAEEIESLGREQFNKLESAIRVLLVHFLKWDHQPERRSRSWMLSIEAQRLRIEDVLADNPGLSRAFPRPSRAHIDCRGSKLRKRPISRKSGSRRHARTASMTSSRARSEPPRLPRHS